MAKKIKKLEGERPDNSQNGEQINNDLPSVAKKDAHTVAVRFHDINDFSKVHEVGTDVSHFDKDRLAKLVELGHVEKG